MSRPSPNRLQPTVSQTCLQVPSSSFQSLTFHVLYPVSDIPFLMPSVQYSIPVPYALCHVPNDKPMYPIHVLDLHLPRRLGPSLPVLGSSDHYHRTLQSQRLCLSSPTLEDEKGRNTGIKKNKNKSVVVKMSKNSSIPCLSQSSSILLISQHCWPKLACIKLEK